MDSRSRWGDRIGRASGPKASSGPSGTGAAGFTLHHRLQGQFQLDVLPQGLHERAVLLTLPVVRAFVGAPATVSSADFGDAMTGLASAPGSGVSGAAPASGGGAGRLHRTPAESTTPALDGRGLRDHWPARPAGQASYSVPVRRVAALLHASLPDPASRRRPCASPILRRHRAGWRTCTSELSAMLGTQKRGGRTATPRSRSVLCADYCLCAPNAPT